MSAWRAIPLAAALLALSSAPVAALTCTQWGRIPPDQKQPTIEQMIRDAVASQRGRDYHVNRNAIERCMMNRSRQIEYDFDDTCADSSRAGMSALDKLFKHYIWSCVN